MGETAEVNSYLRAINPISARLMAERTGYSSQLIPVTSYVTVSAIEAFLRYPDAIETITNSMSPEQIGSQAKKISCQANSVFLWGVANFWLLGRNIMAVIDPSLDNVSNAHTVLNFWARVSYTYRGNDCLHASDDGNKIIILDEATLKILEDLVTPVNDTRRSQIRKINATLINYLFLLYFDTRVGHGDTGPYELPDGRSMLVRDYYRLSKSDFAWSEVAVDLPYQDLTAVFIFDQNVKINVNDFGTSVTNPEDYLNHLESFMLFSNKNNELIPVPDTDFDDLIAKIQKIQKIHYRNIVSMERDEKIKSGAYVYFSFLRPFAEIAGVEKEIEWSCPSAIPSDVYSLVTQEIEPPQQDPNIDPYPYYEEK